MIRDRLKRKKFEIYMSHVKFYKQMQVLWLKAPQILQNQYNATSLLFLRTITVVPHLWRY